MVIKTHRNFDKQFAKLSQKQRKKVEVSLTLFMKIRTLPNYAATP